VSDGLVARVISNIQEKKDRLERGDINCIPSPLPRFRNDFVGVQQGYFYIVTGQTKAGKTQIANFLFLYNPILYAFTHKDKIRIKIFYFPLEETQEAITLRFMSFLLYILSDGKIRRSPVDLKSINEKYPLEQEVIELLKSERYQEILRFYEESVIFIPDRNPTGLIKTAKAYADTHGKTYHKTLEIKDSQGNVVDHREVFDHYEPDDPNEYVIFFWDHASLTDQEKGMTLLQSIGRLSEFFTLIRNRYNYIPVLIQQQSTETGNLEAYKATKIRPTQAGLADNKATARDATVMLGITNPAAFELPNYYKYDIGKLKGHARFLEVIVNREGESNGLIGLYFDGAVNYYEELPLPNETEKLNEIYKKIERQKTRELVMNLYKGIKKVKTCLFNWLLT